MDVSVQKERSIIMDIAVVNQVFQRLPEAAQVEAFDFIQFLASREGKWKAAKARRAFEKIRLAVGRGYCRGNHGGQKGGAEP